MFGDELTVYEILIWQYVDCSSVTKKDATEPGPRAPMPL